MRHIFSDQKKLLDLLKDERPQMGFRSAIDRFLGSNPERGKHFKIGSQKFAYVSRDKKSVSFVPDLWYGELSKSLIHWRGCENWRAGLPLIVFVEISHKSGESSGEIRLNAEVGPVADDNLRKSIIDAIVRSAAVNNLARIRFQKGASDKGRLYSRFLHNSSTAIINVYDANEIERKFAELVSDFTIEFDMIASAITRFSNAP
ncbi:hypothetical protein QE369_003209 [Agrobacterium larrymoorei]|uniref:Uncharacterized protein n=1 Tax=Agrobacterium larrymoorei TaxID=160699 RepID=A0AAJ2BDK3_9HYPH|nr:hypothetical protein [Agrobacterium larrymoorei]MDR6103012.1 hypothetical protein [Agrobacterium larrymoorei]